MRNLEATRSRNNRLRRFYKELAGYMPRDTGPNNAHQLPCRGISFAWVSTQESGTLLAVRLQQFFGYLHYRY
jgi:hypothetical protein